MWSYGAWVWHIGTYSGCGTVGVKHQAHTVGMALCVRWVWYSNCVQWVWHMYQHYIYSTRKYFFSVGIDNKVRICSQEK